MNKVLNCTGNGVEVLGWRFLPNSYYAMSPDGRRTDHIPASVAFSSQAKRLADLGFLEIAGYAPAKAKAPPEAAAPQYVAREVSESVPVSAAEEVVDLSEEVTVDEVTPSEVSGEQGSRKRKHR